MATHSSILAWRIPGMEEPDGLLSMGLHRVRHDWSDLVAAAAAAVGYYLWEAVHYTCVLYITMILLSNVFSRCLFKLYMVIYWFPWLLRDKESICQYREMWVQSLGWEDSLEKGMATHSSILAWEIPWAEEVHGSQRVGHDLAVKTTTATYLYWIKLCRFESDSLIYLYTHSVLLVVLNFYKIKVEMYWNLL